MYVYQSKACWKPTKIQRVRTQVRKVLEQDENVEQEKKPDESPEQDKKVLEPDENSEQEKKPDETSDLGLSLSSEDFIELGLYEDAEDCTIVKEQ